MKKEVHVWRTVATVVVSVIVIICLPIALFGLMLPVNDYEAQGISGAVDCDGPLAVMLFVAPSMVVYAAGAIYYGVLPKGPKRNLLVVLCAVMFAMAGWKAWIAYREKSKPEHQSVCEGRW